MAFGTGFRVDYAMIRRGPQKIRLLRPHGAIFTCPAGFPRMDRRLRWADFRSPTGQFPDAA